jgi:hypothetical protein
VIRFDYPQETYGIDFALPMEALTEVWKENLIAADLSVRTSLHEIIRAAS